MPYSANVYTLPPGTAATTLTPIDSSDYNAFIADIEAAQNAVRPAVAGGTGHVGGSIPTERQNYPTAGGSADALTLTPTIVATAYAAKDVYTFKAAASNTGAATLNVSGVGAKAIRKISGGVDVALVAGDIANGARYGVVYDTSANSAAGGWILTGSASVSSATTSAQGIVELATVAEALAGTDAVRAVTPAGLYLPQDYINGLTITNDTGDATNDLLIAIGEVRSTDDTANMVQASALIKQTDAAWAVGTNAGSLDTGSVGNNRYAIWEIKRVDTNVVDTLTSLSFTAPTMPTNYTVKSLIGEFTRVGGVNGIPINYNRPRIQYSGAAPVFACRAWMNFNGTGTAAARAFGNLTLTDNGTGDYTMTFVTNMPDANYAVSTMFRRNSGTAAAVGLQQNNTATYDQSVSAFRFVSYCPAAGAAEDPLVGHVQVFR